MDCRVGHCILSTWLSPESCSLAKAVPRFRPAVAFVVPRLPIVPSCGDTAFMPLSRSRSIKSSRVAPLGLGLPPLPTRVYPSSSTAKTTLGGGSADGSETDLIGLFFLGHFADWCPSPPQCQHSRLLTGTGGCGHFRSACSLPQFGHFLGAPPVASGARGLMGRRWPR